MSEYLNNCQRIFKITLKDNEDTLYDKYKKLKKIATPEEQKILLKIYKESILNLEEIQEILKKENNDQKSKGKQKKLSSKEFKQLNKQINLDPSVHEQYFIRPLKTSLFDQGIKINNKDQIELRNMIGTGKNINIDKFNQLFDQMKNQNNSDKKNVVNFNDLNDYDFNSSVEGFQTVASYGNTMLHMGEMSHVSSQNENNITNNNFDLNKLNTDGFETYKPSEYKKPEFNSKKINDNSEFLNYRREQLIQEAHRNKQFIQQNSFLFNDPVNLDDSENLKRINLILDN